MFEILVDYPSEDEEFELVRKTTSDHTAQVEKTLSAEEVAHLQQVVRRMPVADHVIRYAMQLAPADAAAKCRHSRFRAGLRFVGRRSAGQPIPVLGAKARAMLKGRAFANTEDVREVAAPVLRHRIITNFNAEADGVSPDTIVRPPDGTGRGRLQQRRPKGGRLPEVFRSADAGEARRA